MLKAFDAVMRHGPVSAAASELGLSQPAVSNALSRLWPAAVLNRPGFAGGNFVQVRLLAGGRAWRSSAPRLLPAGYCR
ncbi:LysR family transcriptional regulator [Camelimonas lactis]|uniref:LysR family transcriptional regulator n=1 Tax=Camelimonas lactis TaxID=659006 RepID=UPI00315CCCDD